LPKDDVTFSTPSASPRLHEILSPEENVAKQKEEIRNSREKLKHPRQVILEWSKAPGNEPAKPGEKLSSPKAQDQR